MEANQTNPKIVMAKAKSIKGSPRKLNLVAALIRGLPVQDAVLQLQFSNLKLAKDVLRVLNSAIANAENNNNLDIDNMKVELVLVGIAFKLRRHLPRAKGSASGIRKPFSNLTIFLKERN